MEKIVVLNPKMQNILTERGFGDLQNNTLVLDSFETLYLLYNNKLELKKVNKNIIYDELIQKYIQKDDDALTRFLLYRDLRTKGYVVKDGFGFDSDFRVYEKGNYGKKMLNLLFLHSMKALNKKSENYTKIFKKLPKWVKSLLLQ